MSRRATFDGLTGVGSTVAAGTPADEPLHFHY
jgi:hypothetical protein